jgi:hypothetical protein
MSPNSPNSVVAANQPQTAGISAARFRQFGKRMSQRCLFEAEFPLRNVLANHPEFAALFR